MSSLIEITRELEELCETVDAMDEIPEALVERFVDKRLAHEHKVGAYTALIRRLRMEEATMAERADVLKRRAKTLGRIQDAVKAHLIYAIESSPDLPWKSNEGDKVRVQENPESLKVDVPTMTSSYRNIILPCDFDIDPQYIMPVSFNVLDTDKVRKTLKDGVTLSWARMEKNGKHLRIY